MEYLLSFFFIIIAKVYEMFKGKKSKKRQIFSRRKSILMSIAIPVQKFERAMQVNG